MDQPFFLHFDNSETSLPPGFRFHPTDEELITYYLLKKVLDANFTGRAIAEVDLNKCEPWQLPEKAKMGEKEWYFFSLRDRKYPTGLRTNRATEAGYWKATGKDREIYSSKTSALVGMKKTLVFYRGRAPKGEKSNWVMHEYRLEGKFAYHYLSRTSKDEWVISRVFQKSATGIGTTTTTTTTGGGGSKTRRGNNSGMISLYGNNDVCSSPSSVSISASQQLPPLLDSCYTTINEACSYDDGCSNYNNNNGSIKKEHVSCFSNTNANTSILNNVTNTSMNIISNFNPFEQSFTPPPPPPLAQSTYMMGPTPPIGGGGGGAFGSLAGFPVYPSLDNLPWIGGGPPMQGGGSGGCELNSMIGGGSGGVNWGGGRLGGIGGTELDCMWS